MGTFVRNDDTSRSRLNRLILQVRVLMTLAGAFELPARGQDSAETSSRGWIELGAGIGAITDAAYTVNFGLRYRSDHQLFDLRVLYSQEIQFMMYEPTPQEEELNIAFLYGRNCDFHLKRMLFPFPFAMIINREADYSFSGSAGVGASWDALRGTRISPRGFESYEIYARDEQFSAIVPLQVELVQYFTPSIGYVHRVYYTFGHARNSWGVLWGLQFGVLE